MGAKAVRFCAPIVLVIAAAYFWRPPGEHPSTRAQFEAAQAQLFADYNIPFESRDLQLRSPLVRVHYLELGDGEPVILVHGERSFAASWTPIAAPLVRRYRTILPDLPGCGLSSGWDYRGRPLRSDAVDFLRSLMDELHIERARLVGSSAGAYYVLAFALACPERVEKIAITGAGPLTNDFLPLRQRVLSIPRLNRWLMPAPSKHLPEDIERIGAGLPGVTESWLSWMEATHGLFGFDARFSIKNELHLLRMPVLLIQGANDQSYSSTGFEAIPKGEALVIPGAGNPPWYSAPDRCARQLAEFLR